MQSFNRFFLDVYHRLGTELSIWWRGWGEGHCTKMKEATSLSPKSSI